MEILYPHGPQPYPSVAGVDAYGTWEGALPLHRVIDRRGSSDDRASSAPQPATRTPKRLARHCEAMTADEGEREGRIHHRAKPVTRDPYVFYHDEIMERNVCIAGQRTQYIWQPTGIPRIDYAPDREKAQTLNDLFSGRKANFVTYVLGE